MSDITNNLSSFWNQIEIPADEWGGAEQYAREQLDLNVDEHGSIVKPDVEGTYAFDKIWDTNKNFLSLALDARSLELRAKREKISLPERNETINHVSGSIRNAFYTLSQQQRSHVIAIDPAQLNVIPEWETIEECVDYAVHAKLPFDSLFLDCELPTRKVEFEPAQVQGGAYRTFGGCVGIDEECLIMLPFGDGRTTAKLGTPVQDDFHLKGGIEAHYLSIGAVVFNMASDPEAPRSDGVFDNTQPIRITDGRAIGHDYRQWEFDLNWLTQLMKRVKDTETAIDFGDLPVEEFEGPPSACRIVVIPPLWESASAHYLINQAALLLVGASTLLRALYFLDTPNIEIVDQQVSRQVRRQAERRGATIAKTIFVKHNSRRSPRNDDDAEHRDFSHRFEVRGHWKYYPEGTQMADARPDLLRYVPGRGMCRKIWCPPHVKGPDDKPLVLKTRRLREEQS